MKKNPTAKEKMAFSALFIFFSLTSQEQSVLSLSLPANLFSVFFQFCFFRKILIIESLSFLLILVNVANYITFSQAL